MLIDEIEKFNVLIKKLKNKYKDIDDVELFIENDKIVLSTYSTIIKTDSFYNKSLLYEMTNILSTILKKVRKHKINKLIENLENDTILNVDSDSITLFHNNKLYKLDIKEIENDELEFSNNNINDIIKNTNKFMRYNNKLLYIKRINEVSKDRNIYRILSKYFDKEYYEISRDIFCMKVTSIYRDDKFDIITESLDNINNILEMVLYGRDRNRNKKLYKKIY